MINKLKTNNNSKLVRIVWWILLIAIIFIFILIIFRPSLKLSLINFIYQVIFGQNTILDDVFLHQYQVFFLCVPILMIFIFCISVIALSMIFKKYKKADWIFAIVCLIAVMGAVIIPTAPVFIRANRANHEVYEMIVEDRFIKNGFRHHSSWLKLSDGSEVRVYFTQYEKISIGDSVYVVYFEDYDGKTPVVFTNDKYTLPQ